jgi:heme A synthase
LVADDPSFARAWVMAFHLINTLLLLGCLGLTIWVVQGKRRLSFSNRSPLNWLLVACLSAFVLLGASGAVAALGDTLFPAEGIAEALQQDFSPGANLLIRLRVYHPALALLLGLLVITVVAKVSKSRPDPTTRLLAFVTGFLYLAQLGVGLFNLLLLAPVWLQLVHLFLADVIWVGMVLLTASTLSEPAASVVVE